MQKLNSNTFEKKVNELTLSDPDLLSESPGTYRVGDNEMEEADIDDNKKKFRYVPLIMNGRTHLVSDGSKSVIREVSMSQLSDMADRFYQKAFQDETLDKILRSHDDPQKLSGSKKWDKDRQQRSQEPVKLAGGRRHVVHDRSSAHVATWHSPKRNRNEVGRHFRLDECRVWMRLHFWALRESGIMEISPSFADYYIRFIAHFVRVYENAAPLFARDSFRWSSNPKNIEQCVRNGSKMKDVLGLPFHKALAQIPESESEEADSPYDVTD